MAARFAIDAIFRATDRITRPIARMARKVDRFARSARRGFRDMDRMASGLFRGLRRVGAAAAAAGVAMGALGASVISTGAEFEQSLTNAAAKFPGAIRRGTEEFALLEETAARIGAETEFTASQAAQGLDFLAMAGFNAQQAVAALPGVVDLATAASMELGQASDIATDSLGAFNLMTTDAAQLGLNLARVNDVIAKTTTTANTNVEDMFEAIRTGAPIATSAGQSMETFSAMVGTLANAGIKGSEAGTALRNMFLRLQAPAAAGRDALRRLGVSVKDSHGNMRDAVDVMGDIEQATASMGTVQRAQILNDIFGQRAIGPATVLLNSGAAALRQYRTTLEGAEGAAADMAATMRNTTTGDINSLKSAVEGIQIAIFDVVRGPVREMIASMTGWARANREVIASRIQAFTEGLVAALPQIAYWGEKIGIVAGVFLGVATAIKVASAAMAIFNAVMALNPVTAIAMAIIAAIALIIAFWPEISAFLSDLWDSITWVAEQIGDALSSMWETVKEGALAAFDFLLGALVIMFGPVIDLLAPVFAFIVDAAGWVMAHWGQVKAFFSVLWGFIKLGAETAWDAVVTKATEIYQKVRDAFEPLRQFFADLWQGIKDMFWEKVGAVVDFVMGVVDRIRGVGQQAREGDLAGARASATSPELVTPSERTARTISETNTTNRAEVTIRDETGRAQMTRRPRGGSAGIVLQPSGAT